MVIRPILAYALAAAVVVPFPAAARPAGQADCSTILPPAQEASGKRPLAPEDLVRLRDIGPVDQSLSRHLLRNLARRAERRLPASPGRTEGE